LSIAPPLFQVDLLLALGARQALDDQLMEPRRCVGVERLSGVQSSDRVEIERGAV
jgi:hypothetical protein